MRILALDVGTRTIGVAVSDELGITANGVKTIRRKNLDHDLFELRSIIDTYHPCEIVVGIPYNIDGSVSKRGKEIMAFAKRIEEEFGIPVVFWDESFSTVEAEKRLLEADLSRKKRKRVIDKMAAVVILEEYLSSL